MSKLSYKPSGPVKTTESFAVPTVDWKLIAKYDTSGPRYTSYPTAPQFTEEFTAHDLQETIHNANLQLNPPPLSLYFHLPFCESVCFFCGCNVTFTADRSRPHAYTQTLIQEMDLVKPLLQKRQKVHQLHWGGGTPTFFSPDQLNYLGEGIYQRFSFAENAEIGLEIDPRETKEEHLKVLSELGFNRLSMGIQDFDPTVQKAINRNQPETMTRNIIESAREHGFQSISVDLIYGLPHQSEKTFAKTLEKIIQLNPDRIALFNFAYLPEMIRHQKAIASDALPSAAEKFAILRRAITRFGEAGYRYIGMDHFAKPHDTLCQAQDQGTLSRNFQGYTTHGDCDLYAFGVSAISQIQNVYAQNQKNIHDYTKALANHQFATQRGIRLTPDDLLRREIIMTLMCHFSLDIQAIEKKYHILFADYFSEELKALSPFEKDELIRLSHNIIQITSTGRLLVRNLCMIFDAYLKQKPTQKFSRTI
ncbi:MAG: oxygen-independent coproporphyrinogen III oxidase [Verrucomicrobiae bacterium]|nr:oxygen-independent coproporphyrinogen III oxidase [Verrucomicrobiae bacterium]